MPKKTETTSARDRILAVADELFYREGIRAIGVDTIIAQSKVAKTTLYRYFPSKDDLIVAYLDERNRRFWVLFEAAVNLDSTPKEQLLAVFEWLDELLAKPDCYGCPFLITTTEFPELDYPGHQVAVAHKRAVRERLSAIAQQAGASNATELGTHLLLLMDGAFAQRRLFGPGSSGVQLKTIAAILINAY